MEKARKLVASVRNGEISEANALETLHAEVEVAKFNADMEAKFGHCCTAIPPNVTPEKTVTEKELEQIQEEREAAEKRIQDAEDFVAYARRKSGLD